VPEKMLTPKQAAERMQIRESTVLAWLRGRKMPGMKVGRVWRIREEDLDGFIRRLATGEITMSEEPGEEDPGAGSPAGEE